MQGTKFFAEGCRIEYSEEASVQLPSGEWWSAFQHNTFVARVERPDGATVIIVFPANARPGPTTPTLCADLATDSGAPVVVFGG